MLCANFCGAIFILKALVGMLCATLRYALCNYWWVYILMPEWESSLPYALCNLNLCFVLFLWGYIYSQRWVGMLCATLPYALCNFLRVYILKPEWESLPYAVCNLNLCFVLFFVGLYIFSRLSGNALCNLILCFVQ